MDRFMFSKKFSKMAKVSIEIFVFVESNYCTSGSVGNSCHREPSFISMRKRCFTVFSVMTYEPVHGTERTPKRNCCSFLITACVYKFFDHVILPLFIHCK